MKYQDLGQVSVQEATILQEEERQKILEGKSKGTLFLCEHPHTVTVGRKLEKDYSQIRDIIPSHVEVVSLNRGGELTYHGPGQIVIYPVISIEECGFSVRKYISFLEETLVQVLSDYGIKSTGNPNHRGVWSEGKKCASIGVHISRGISIHGVALNVSCDLKYFSYFKPCGLCHTDITSMEKILERKVDLLQLEQNIVKQFAQVLSKARSSGVERYVDIVEVSGSRPLAPTTCI